MQDNIREKSEFPLDYFFNTYLLLCSLGGVGGEDRSFVTNHFHNRVSTRKQSCLWEMNDHFHKDQGSYLSSTQLLLFPKEIKAKMIRRDNTTKTRTVLLLLCSSTLRNEKKFSRTSLWENTQSCFINSHTSEIKVVQFSSNIPSNIPWILRFNKKYLFPQSLILLF